MPGPWDGPVRVIAETPTSFRFATLAGHLEAGQIEFRASADHRSVALETESWARSGDRFSDALYSHVRLAKEVQLHTWVSAVGKVADLAQCRTEGGVIVTTRRVGPAGPGPKPDGRRARRRLAALAERSSTSTRRISTGVRPRPAGTATTRSSVCPQRPQARQCAPAAGRSRAGS
jgi:hypothetical protein